MLKKIILIVVGIILIGSLLVPTIGSTTEPPAETNNLNVFVLAGQSNAAYYNENISVANENTPIKNDFAYYYGTEDAPINCGVINDLQYDTTLESYGVYSMTDTDGVFRIGNIEAPFASYFVNETNQKVLIINTGIGGVSIASYVPGTVGFEYAKKIIADALTKIPDGLNPVLKGVMWVQGESNAAYPVNTYIQNFESISDGFKELGFNGIFISKTKADNGGNASFAQTLIPERVSGAHLVTQVADTFTISNGLLASDNLHYTQKADNILGKDFAAYLISAYGYPVAQLSEYSSLISIIPLLCIVAIVLWIAVDMLRKRYD